MTARKPPAKKPRTYRPRAPKQLNDIAIVTLTLHRESGDITIDTEFSTPMETWAALEWAAADVKDRLSAVRGLPDDE